MCAELTVDEAVVPQEEMCFYTQVLLMYDLSSECKLRVNLVSQNLCDTLRSRPGASPTGLCLKMFLKYFTITHNVDG